MHEFESEGGCAFAKRREGALAVLGFVVVEAEWLVGVASLPHVVEDAGELVRGGGDGLGRAETGAQAAVEAAESGVAVGGRLRGATQGGGDAADNFAGLGVLDRAARDAVVRAEGEPGGEVLLGGNRLGARPTSERIVGTVRASKPSMRVKSTPAIR
jgi:hypothetical protein